MIVISDSMLCASVSPWLYPYHHRQVLSRIARACLIDVHAQPLPADVAKLRPGENDSGPPRLARSPCRYLNHRANIGVIELQLQMNLPMSEWPDEPGGVFIARKLARKFSPQKWWQVWK